MKPGTRLFTGPLRPAQQRRRERAKRHFAKIADMADARNISVADALRIEGTEEEWRARELWNLSYE